MSDEITYAMVGGPPDNWKGITIIDLDTGLEACDVIEVDAGDGWLIRAARDGRGLIYAEEKLNGRFEIRPRPE